MRSWLRILAPCGMVSAICYGVMVILGQMLWQEYEPISSFVSYLTADGAPNAHLTQTLNNIHGLCLLLFALGMYQRALRYYHRITILGYGFLFAASIIALVGFAVCPISLYESFSSIRNMTHFFMTVAIVVATILAAALLGIGYIRHEGLALLGRVILSAGGLICVLAAASLISIFALPGVMGLAQRLMLFSLEGFVFFLSYNYTFVYTMTQRERDG